MPGGLIPRGRGIPPRRGRGAGGESNCFACGSADPSALSAHIDSVQLPWCHGTFGTLLLQQAEQQATQPESVIGITSSSEAVWCKEESYDKWVAHIATLDATR